MEGGGLRRISLQVSQNCVVASIQIDLSDKILHQFRKDLLERLQSSACTGVILDVSGVEIIDLQDFNALRLTMYMAAVMGAQTVISGLRPGVVSALIELGAEVDGIKAALNLDDAFRLMNSLRSSHDMPEEVEESNEPTEDSDEDR